MNRAISQFALLVMIAAAGAGCASGYAKPNTGMEGAQAKFDVPPKELLARIKQALNEPPLNIGVTQDKDGSLLTGYQSFPGEFHIARRWQERTRYRIRVSPDFDQPTQRSQVVIIESTEQRAAEGMTWEAFDVPARPERAAELLKQLQKNITSSGGGATTTTTTTRAAS